MPSSRKIRSKDFCTSTPLGWVVACGVKAKLILPLGLSKTPVEVYTVADGNTPEAGSRMPSKLCPDGALQRYSMQQP